jgi:hypothetical protein
MAFEKILDPPEPALTVQVGLDTMLLRLFFGTKVPQTTTAELLPHQ